MRRVLSGTTTRTGSARGAMLGIVGCLACVATMAGRLELAPYARAAEEGAVPAGTEAAGGASSANEIKPAETTGATSPAGTSVAREGTQLEHVAGRFRREGDRFLFVSQDQRWNVFVLENLMLERVGQLMGDSQRGLEWQVSGTLTEFQGGNYLLLSRATARPAGVRHRSESADRRAW